MKELSDQRGVGRGKGLYLRMIKQLVVRVERRRCRVTRYFTITCYLPGHERHMEGLYSCQWLAPK